MNNTKGKILKAIGVLTIIFGFIASIGVWIVVDNATQEFREVIQEFIGYSTADAIYGGSAFTAAIVTFISSFISGMLFIGFSEVIFLLQENLNANKVTSVQTRVEKNVETDELPEI